MTSYDEYQGSEQDADSHEENSHNYTRMAGDLVTGIDFTANGDYTHAGPAKNVIDAIKRPVSETNIRGVITPTGAFKSVGDALQKVR